MKASRNRGAATVEFALVLVILLLLLFGMLEIGRAMFKWNSAAEATRIGARTAAIVAVNDKAKVLAAMQPMMPELTADNVTLQYSTDGISFGGACTRHLHVGARRCELHVPPGPDPVRPRHGAAAGVDPDADVRNHLHGRGARRHMSQGSTP